ncbi:MAG: hypothetical protein KGP35_06195 [Bacteroidetes bacterium]|nr:hypothetical protein [Bacteroidota bacterium]
MPSVCVTDKKWTLSFLFLLGISCNLFAQDNTPWSRYGLGESVPAGNILNRGMGQVAAAYYDQQTINFINPASYAQFGQQKALLDVGVDYQSRSLRDQKDNKATFSNIFIPYVAGGFQLSGEKSKRKIGVAFGLRPISKINYNLESGSKTGEDSVVYTYEGNGGLYQAFAGTAFRIQQLSLGVNLGYRFGTKDNTTRVFLFNQTEGTRFTSGQKELRQYYGGLFTEIGLQYDIRLSTSQSLCIGGYGSFASSMQMKTDETIATFFRSGESGNEVFLDSIKTSRGAGSTIDYPSYYGFGLMYHRTGKSRLSIGGDFTAHEWQSYRFAGKPDLMNNSWEIKTGAQWIPNIEKSNGKFGERLIYRAGFIYAKEPFFVDGSLNSYAINLGLGIPIKKYSYAEYNRNNLINIALQFGNRGNSNQVIREQYFRLAISASLSDIWFIKSKYD